MPTVSHAGGVGGEADPLQTRSLHSCWAQLVHASTRAVGGPIAEYTLTVAGDRRGGARRGERPSDEELVERTRGGSEAAFAAIVERYTDALTHHCARIVDRSAAEDAVQETFVAAWAALGADTAVTHLRPWLFTIARRKALTARRRDRVVVAFSELLAASRSSADEADDAARARAALAALAALPEDEREALLRSALHGQSGAEIARTLGVPEPSVRQLVFRARASVRATAASCLAPPLVLGRLLRRAVGTAARRGGGLAAKLGTGTTLLKAGAVVSVATVVASAAAHDSPRRARGAPAAPAVARAPRVIGDVLPRAVGRRSAPRTTDASAQERSERWRTQVRPQRPRPPRRARAPVPPTLVAAATPANATSAPVVAQEPGGEVSKRDAAVSSGAPAAPPIRDVASGPGLGVPAAPTVPAPVTSAVATIVQAAGSAPAALTQAVGNAISKIGAGSLTQSVGSVIETVGQQAQGATGVLGSVQTAITGATGATGPVASVTGLLTSGQLLP